MAPKKEVSIYNFTTIKGLVWWRWGGADSIRNSSQNREDVYEHVLDLFYQLFTSLEEHLRIFNPDNKSIFMVCTGSSVHKYSATCTLSEMLSTVMVLELRINQHKNCGDDAEIKGGSSVELCLLKNPADVESFSLTSAGNVVSSLVLLLSVIYVLIHVPY